MQLHLGESHNCCTLLHLEVFLGAWDHETRTPASEGYVTCACLQVLVDVKRKAVIVVGLKVPT